MDAKYKEVLVEQKPFLVRNVVVNSDLLAFLREQHVFLDTMFEEIEDCRGREKKVAKMVELLAIRPRSAFLKFCDCLFFSGHSYIAEHLKEEEGTEGKVFNISDIFKKIPMLDKMLRDGEKTELKDLIQKKPESEMFRREAWKTTQDKEKALDTGTKNIEQSWAHLKEMRDKDGVIGSLHKKLDEEKRANQDRVFEIRQTRSQYAELKQKYDKVLAVQTRYSQANESTIKRLEERIGFMDKLVASVNNRMRDYLGKDPQLSEKDIIVSNRGLSMFRENFECLMRRVAELQAIKTRHDELTAERENMMSFFGLENDNKRTLWGAFREHMVRLDDKIQMQRQEIVALNFKLNAKKMLLKRQTEKAMQAGDAAEAAAAVSSAEAESMQRELADMQELKAKVERLNEHLQAKLQIKENRIKELEQELEASKVSLDHTRSQVEMEKLRMSLKMERELQLPKPDDTAGTSETPEEDALLQAYGDALLKEDSRPVSREVKDLNDKPIIPPIANSPEKAASPLQDKEEELDFSQTFKVPKRKVLSRGTGNMSSTFHDMERLDSAPLSGSLTVKKL